MPKAAAIRKSERPATPRDRDVATAQEVRWLTVRGAVHNNLKNIDVGFPLGRFTCVTGVSGSGKSSLINDILQPALARALNGATVQTPGPHAGIDGLEHLDKVIAIDQSPIGRTPRSNPATYIKVFDEIRTLFTKLPDSKLRGYKPGRFSFNVATGPRGGGRCEACEGNGANRIEMDFLADVWVTCPVCSGHRFGRETLQIHYKGKSIADVLEMDVQDALGHFESQTRIRAMLQTLHDVGLDYVKLGQSSTTLSGGEAQRIKLARELVKKPTGRTMYILDEPTTGLHFDDVRRLLEVLQGFVDAGNTVLVIEHNLDVVKTADWIIDLGPEGGDAGGTVVAEGTPEDVAACEESHTGRALAEVLNGEWRMANGEFRGPVSDRSSEAEKPSDDDHSTFDIRHSPFADAVTVVGARQHNLKDLTVSFPRNQTTVCTGLSGSGKTSFAIDTVYTEGHRRYVESLSAYARQFLGQMAKPRVDHVHGLSPAICIEQKAASRSPRSTVGTITEIYDYMRVLWARVGTAYCHRCDIPIGTQTADEICARVMALDEGAPIVILAPVALGDGESYASIFNRLKASGYRRVRIDGEIQETAMSTTLDARRKHRVEVVVDRAIVRTKSRSRIAESIEHALALGNGVMNLLEEPFETVETDEHGGVTETQQRQPRQQSFSQRFACTQCGTSYSELTPHHFSFNSQLGWCETCEGLGVQRGAPESQIVANARRSLLSGGIAGWPSIERRSHHARMLMALCENIGVDVDLPLGDWSDAEKRVLMFGSNHWIDAGKAMPGLRFQWKGFFPAIDDATRNSWSLRHKLQNVVAEIPCVACRGGRLRPDASAARLGGRTIVDICETPLERAAEFFRTLDLDAAQRRVAGELLKEVQNRLEFLIDVGLEYLALHRSAPTLSGGESQRIRLAGQIGSGLSGVLYVLDEPTIGLHPRDTGRLVRALRKLRDLGNTLLMVEHDREVIADADHLLDFGPGAGVNGGRLVN
jgi:excinuclease ABC subunit A